MNHRTLVSALVAASLLLPALARAGGTDCRVQGPAKDGRTYTLSAFSCHAASDAAITAVAEGVVGGARTSIVVALQPVHGRPGTFRFQRTWSNEGRWALTVSFGGHASPVAVLASDTQGRFGAATFVLDGQAAAACDAALGLTAASAAR